MNRTQPTENSQVGGGAGDARGKGEVGVSLLGRIEVRPHAHRHPCVSWHCSRYSRRSVWSDDLQHADPRKKNFLNLVTKINTQMRHGGGVTNIATQVIHEHCCTSEARERGAYRFSDRSRSVHTRFVSPAVLGIPLPSEYGTHKTVKARIWPWLSGNSPHNFPSCSFFARKRPTAQP